MSPLIGVESPAHRGRHPLGGGRWTDGPAATPLLAAASIAFLRALAACNANSGIQGPADSATDSTGIGTLDTGADGALDAGADASPPPADAPADEPMDAPADAPQDALHGDGNCEGGVQAQCNALVATITVASKYKPMDNGICTATELALYEKFPTSGAAGACLKCAFDNGVLDYTPPIPMQANSNECEDLGAVGDAGSPASIQQCIDTLLCDLGLTGNDTDSCGSRAYDRMATPMRTLLLNAFCGAGVSTSSCQNGGATGTCQTAWRAGFEGLSDVNIIFMNSSQGYPSGMANNLAGGLLVNCASECFP